MKPASIFAWWWKECLQFAAVVDESSSETVMLAYVRITVVEDIL
jgi:hypothetical protein